MALLRCTFLRLTNVIERCLGNKLVRRYSHDGKIPKKTLADIKVGLSEKMGQLSEFEDQSVQEKSALYGLLPLTQEELPERTMEDSYDECLVPLAHSGKMRNRYATVKGYVRMGRILEDLDMMAVWLCLKYIKNPKDEHTAMTPYTIVTVLVDNISIESERPRVWNNLRLSGHVVWAGKTSMEARILVDFLDDKTWKPFTKAFFVMAARNAETNKGAFVNKMTPKGKFEQDQWEKAIIRKKRRRIDEKMSLLKVPPKPEEQQMIFEKYMSTMDLASISENLGKRKLPDNNIWITDTKNTIDIHPHPEFRNHHNTFFGGTLMRIAIELGFTTVFEYAKERPQLVFISKVDFKIPVMLDSFLKYVALVTYSDGNFACVTVISEMTELVEFAKQLTNVYHLIFSFQSPVCQVLPSTYIEALLHVQSIRHFNYYKNEFLNHPTSFTSPKNV